MSKYKINKNDASRILLTELLPYEVPILFSNEGLYNYYNDSSSKPNFIRKVFEGEYKIPFTYKIRKGLGSSRNLSIIHPAIQLKFIEFYKRYDSLIIHLCNRSPISLRFPAKVASHFYTRNYKVLNSSVDKGIEIQPDVLNQEFVYASSYFAYDKYPLLFKFYDSYEFLRLEKKFKHLLLFDIQKCFDSIYTHSISWAIKSKDFAKANRDNPSFEKEFDTLMQKSNYNETNGILIGSEAARIFAEIILQKVDLEAIEKLKQKGYSYGSDYVVKRYVDDYFVFAHDEKSARDILREFSLELEKFKLHISDSKTENFTAPFISGITVARIEIQKLIESFFDKHLVRSDVQSTEDNLNYEVSSATNFRNLSNSLIRDVKAIVKSHSVDYGSISNLMFATFKKGILKIYKSNIDDLSESKKGRIIELILVLLDTLFFLYSMDYKMRTTYVVTELILNTIKFTSVLDDSSKHTIFKKVYDESIYLIKNISHETNPCNIELLNLLLGLRSLGEDYLLEADSLRSLLNIDKDIDAFSYFQYVVILYYIKDDSRYASIRDKLESAVISKISVDKAPFHKTELTLLMFDIVSCPYVSRKTKELIVEIGYYKVESRNPSDPDRNWIINYISERNWFINWHEEVELENLLKRKELHTPY